MNIFFRDDLLEQRSKKTIFNGKMYSKYDEIST